MKKWYNSKTIWIAVIQALAGIVAAFVYQYPEIGLLLVVKSGVDITLRLITEMPVK